MVATLLEQLKLSENLSQLQQMMADAKRNKNQGEKLEDLSRIIKDLEF